MPPKAAEDSGLGAYIDKKVEIITNDGQVLVGILKGYDQTTNIILQECEERSFSLEGTEIVSLGLYLIRGDNISIVALVEQDLDESINWETVKADPIRPLVGHVVQ